MIPIELDDAAQVHGASPVQVYRRIYLPLMAPALAAVGTFALLLAWNDMMATAIMSRERLDCRWCRRSL